MALLPGHSLKYSGGETATLFDENWNKIGEVVVDLHGFAIGQGSHSVIFDCNFSGEAAEAALELRLEAKRENVELPETN